MRKYKVIVEAEITLKDWANHLEIIKLNKSNPFTQLINEDDEYQNVYRLNLNITNLEFGEELTIANINKIKVEEIND